jgi:hypothetical protein
VERIDDVPRTAVRSRSRRPGREALPTQPDRPLAEQFSRLFPVVVMVGIAWALAWQTDGSIAAHDWLPYALLGSLVLSGALLAGGRVRPNRLCGAALLIVDYAAFVALSIAWAPIQSLARDEALLVLLYAMTLAVALLTLRTADDRLYAGGVVALGASTLTLAAAVKLRTVADPTDFFFGGRLDFPITYINAQAAATLVGFWPAVVVAARRTAPVWLRALAVGGATTLLCGWLATQSKGGGLGLVSRPSSSSPYPMPACVSRCPCSSPGPSLRSAPRR